MSLQLSTKIVLILNHLE